jgi:membrane fusion protein, heavy metal efflux system
MRNRLPTLLAATLLVAACKEKAPPATPQPPAGEVWLTDKQLADGHFALETVAVRPVSSPVVAPARVAFDDLRVAHVFSPVTGRVVRVLAHLGERVKKGTPLVTVHSPDVGQAKSDLAKAHADVEQAEQELRRQRELNEARAGARRDLEAAEAAEAKARAEFARADEKARLLHTYGLGVSQEYAVRSPIDGEVIFRTVNPGQEIQGQYSGGQAVELFTIGELDPIWVIADVFSLDLPAVSRGAPVRVTLPALPGRVFEGKVDWIAGALDPAARTAKVRTQFPNPGRDLRPEMVGTAEIAGRAREALAVPRSAVLRVADGLTVFVEGGRTPDGRTRFERRSVELNDRGGDWLPVVKGLAPGDRVVSSGAILMLGML